MYQVEIFRKQKHQTSIVFVQPIIETTDNDDDLTTALSTLNAQTNKLKDKLAKETKARGGFAFDFVKKDVIPYFFIANTPQDVLDNSLAEVRAKALEYMNANREFITEDIEELKKTEVISDNDILILDTTTSSIYWSRISSFERDSTLTVSNLVDEINIYTDEGSNNNNIGDLLPLINKSISMINDRLQLCLPILSIGVANSYITWISYSVISNIIMVHASAEFKLKEGEINEFANRSRLAAISLVDFGGSYRNTIPSFFKINNRYKSDFTVDENVKRFNEEVF